MHRALKAWTLVTPMSSVELETLAGLTLPAILARGRRWENEGRIDAALIAYQRARLIDPLAEDGHRELARLWCRSDPRIAALIAEAGLRHTGAESLREAAARAWLAAEQYDRALRLTATHPQPSLGTIAAQALEGMGRTDEADSLWHTLWSSNPALAIAAARVARSMLRNARRPQGEAVLRAAEASSKSADDFVAVGQCHLEEGSLAEAYSCFEKARSRDKGSVAALVGMASVMEKKNRLADAERLLRRVIKATGSIDAHLLLARVLGRRNDPEAMAILAKAASLAPENERVRTALEESLSQLKPSETPRAGNSFSGTLGVFPLPDIIEFLSMQRLSGVLTLRTSAGRAARLWLAQGNLLAAQTPDHPFPPELGHAKARASDLIATILDDNAVRVRIHRQVIEALSSLVEWTEAQFDFVAESRDIHASWAVDARLAVFDAVRRMDERIRERE